MARLGETTRSLCADDNHASVRLCVVLRRNAREKERSDKSGYVSWIGGITIVVAPKMRSGYKVLQWQGRFGYHLPLSFGTSFLSVEEKKALKRLNNFNLDFDLLEISVNNTRFNALLLLRRRHHDGVCLDIIIRPRTD